MHEFGLEDCTRARLINNGFLEVGYDRPRYWLPDYITSCHNFWHKVLCHNFEKYV